MEKVKIDLNEPLQPGDVIELHFNSIGLTWLQSVQIAFLEYHVQKKFNNFEIINWSIVDKTKIIFTIRIRQTNPVAVTAAIIGAAIIGTGIIGLLLLEKAYKIIESPQGKIITAGIGSIAIAVLAAVFIGALRRK